MFLFPCWALAPFFCCFAVVSRGETQIWPGDLRVVSLLFFSVSLFVMLVDLPSQGTTVFLDEFLINLLAYTSFRTEP